MRPVVGRQWEGIMTGLPASIMYFLVLGLLYLTFVAQRKWDYGVLLLIAVITGCSLGPLFSLLFTTTQQTAWVNALSLLILNIFVFFLAARYAMVIEEDENRAAREHAQFVANAEEMAPAFMEMMKKT